MKNGIIFSVLALFIAGSASAIDLGNLGKKGEEIPAVGAVGGDKELDCSNNNKSKLEANLTPDARDSRRNDCLDFLLKNKESHWDENFKSFDEVKADMTKFFGMQPAKKISSDGITWNHFFYPTAGKILHHANLGDAFENSANQHCFKYILFESPDKTWNAQYSGSVGPQFCQ